MQPDTPTPDIPQPDNPVPRPPSNPDPDVPAPQVPDGDPPPMPGPPEGDPPARDPTQPQELPGQPSRPVPAPNSMTSRVPLAASAWAMGRASVRANSGDNSGAVTKSLPSSARRPNLRAPPL